jgi:hypothetical protein
MTVGEKLEQALTKRPNAYVPARTWAHLLLLLLLSEPDQDHCMRNMAMHYGTGSMVGLVRGVIAHAGLGASAGGHGLHSAAARH